MTTEFDNYSRVTLEGPNGPVAVYPYAGRPKKVESIVYGPEPYNERHKSTTTLTHAARAGSTPGTYVVELDSERSSELDDFNLNDSWDLVTLRNRTFEYDDFSNVRSVVTTTIGSNGEPQPPTRRVDETTYVNLADDRWLIGKPDVRASMDCTHPDTPDQRCVTRTTDHDYDLVTGKLTGITVEPGDPTLKLHTEIEYGAYGNIRSVTSSDSAGKSRTNRVTYDQQGVYPRLMFNALDHKTTVNIDSQLGVVLDRTDANGVLTTMKYDRFGQLREVNHSDGSFERFGTFGPTYRLLSVPDGLGGVVTREALTTDNLGRPLHRDVLAFDGTRDRVSTSYDEVGRVHAVTRPYKLTEAPSYATTYMYDRLDRLVQTEHPMARSSDMSTAVERLTRSTPTAQKVTSAVGLTASSTLATRLTRTRATG